MNLNLSIIIVTYNCAGFIQSMFDDLLPSLYSYKNYEILIADNNSSDNTIQVLKSILNIDNISLLVLSENIGFSRANNLLINKANFENILLLNPDVFGFTYLFWKQLFIQWDRINPLFIKLLNKDGILQDCVGDIVSLKRIFKRILLKNEFLQIKKKREVGMGILAFMLVPKFVFRKVGLLAENYHMYAEDMDWCYRAYKSGYKLFYDPSIFLIHIGGASSSTIWRNNEKMLMKYSSERIFILKYYKGLYRMILLLSNDLKILSCKLK